MPYLSPVIVLIAGLLCCAWCVMERAPIPFAFFAFVAAVGAYELSATFLHEREQGSES